MIQNGVLSLGLYRSYIGDDAKINSMLNIDFASKEAQTSTLIMMRNSLKYSIADRDCIELLVFVFMFVELNARGSHWEQVVKLYVKYSFSFIEVISKMAHGIFVS